MADILRNGSFRKSISGAEVQAKDVRKLKPGQWLNDEVLNFYAVMLNKCAGPLRLRADVVSAGPKRTTSSTIKRARPLLQACRRLASSCASTSSPRSSTAPSRSKATSRSAAGPKRCAPPWPHPADLARSTSSRSIGSSCPSTSIKPTGSVLRSTSGRSDSSSSIRWAAGTRTSSQCVCTRRCFG